jgi:MFS family permease
MVLVARFVAAPRDLPIAAAGLVDYGFSAGPVGVGLFLLPTMLVATGTALVLGRIARRRGWKWPLVGSMATLTTSLVVLAMSHAHAWEVAVATSILGLSLGISTIGAKLVADAVPSSDRATVAGMNMVAFYIGGVIGTQGVTAILDAQSIPGTGVPTQGAYSLGLMVLAGATAGGLILALLIQPMRASAEQESLLAPATAGSAGEAGAATLMLGGASE